MNSSILEQISITLNSIKAKCQLKDKTIAEQLRVSCSELKCLKNFLSNDHISVKDLAEGLGITSGGVTKIVGQLEEKNILRRDMDPDDRRGILVSLTGEGRDLITELHKNTIGYYDALFGGLSEKNMEDILKGILLLNESWDNLISRYHGTQGNKNQGGENC
jgi:DNA-binding MarR family transcriptional regulator